MKTFIAITCAILTAFSAFSADNAKPKIKVAADGFPAGHNTPEGVACDLARAFIKHDMVLFTNTCIQPFGASETFGTNYQTFLKLDFIHSSEGDTTDLPSDSAMPF